MPHLVIAEFFFLLLSFQTSNDDHYYESLQTSYQLPSSPPNRAMPLRKAPLPPTPTNASASNTGTLSHYHSDFVGVPFVLNPKLQKSDMIEFDLPKFNNKTSDQLDYDFQLERQILVTTKDEKRKSTSTNPFF